MPGSHLPFRCQTHAAFAESSLILLAATVAGALDLFLRQPLIIAFILIGITAGPSVLGRMSMQSGLACVCWASISTPKPCMRRRRASCRHGTCDSLDADFIHTLPLRDRVWVISTLPDIESNRTLLKLLTKSRYTRGFAFVTRDDGTGLALEQIGAFNALYPLRDAIGHAAQALAPFVLNRRTP